MSKDDKHPTPRSRHADHAGDASLQQRHADNDAAQIKLKAELADLAAIPPQDRTPAQNARLQAIEVERQQLTTEAETIAAALDKAR